MLERRADVLKRPEAVLWAGGAGTLDDADRGIEALNDLIDWFGRERGRGGVVGGVVPQPIPRRDLVTLLGGVLGEVCHKTFHAAARFVVRYLPEFPEGGEGRVHLRVGQGDREEGHEPRPLRADVLVPREVLGVLPQLPAGADGRAGVVRASFAGGEGLTPAAGVARGARVEPLVVVQDALEKMRVPGEARDGDGLHGLPPHLLGEHGGGHEARGGGDEVVVAFLRLDLGGGHLRDVARGVVDDVNFVHVFFTSLVVCFTGPCAAAAGCDARGVAPRSPRMSASPRRGRGELRVEFFPQLAHQNRERHRFGARGVRKHEVEVVEEYDELLADVVVQNRAMF